MLRDRLLCWVSNDKIQRRLLAEPNLTLNRAMDLAITIETSNKGAQLHDVHESSIPRGSTVNKLEKGLKDSKRARNR